MQNLHHLLPQTCDWMTAILTAATAPWATTPRPRANGVLDHLKGGCCATFPGCRDHRVIWLYLCLHHHGLLTSIFLPSIILVNEVYGACFILIGWRYVLCTPECSWRLLLLAHLKHPYMKMQIMGKVCVMSHCSSTWPPTRRTSMTWSCRRRAFHGTRVFW
jgi:hypothetical protein